MWQIHRGSFEVSPLLLVQRTYPSFIVNSALYIFLCTLHSRMGISHINACLEILLNGLTSMASDLFWFSMLVKKKNCSPILLDDQIVLKYFTSCYENLLFDLQAFSILSCFWAWENPILLVILILLDDQIFFSCKLLSKSL